MKEETNSVCGYARGNQNQEVEFYWDTDSTAVSSKSTQPSIRVLIRIGMGKTVIPALSQVLLCKLIINMTWETKQRGRDLG